MHPTDHLLKPPSKSVGFNPSLKATDGMLLNSLVRAGMSHADASISIERYARACDEKLRNDKFLSLASLGRLVVDSDDTVRFIQDDDTDLLRESFGLKPVQLTPVLRQVERKPRQVPEEVAKPRRIGPWIAAASFLLLVSVGASLYFFNDQVHQQVVGVFKDVFQKPHSERAVNVTVPIPDQNSFAMEWEALVQLRFPLEVPEPLAKPETENPKLETSSSSGYFVIVGAFGSEANAQRQLDRVRAQYPESQVFRSGGLNQVGVFASDDESRANEILKDVRSSFEANAWLTKR
jgi:hypothetical protein